MKNRRGYGSRHGQFESRRINDGPSEELRKSTKESERRRDVEVENNKREPRINSNDERNERQFEVYDSTRINGESAKTCEEARRSQNEPSEELRNTRNNIERRTDVEDEKNRSGTRRRSNDARIERQVETFDNTRFNRRVAQPSEDERRLPNEPSHELRNARKENDRRSDTKTRQPKRISNDRTHERQLELLDITRINRKVTNPSGAGRINDIKESENVETKRIDRRVTKIREESSGLQHEPSVELRNTGEEREKASYRN